MDGVTYSHAHVDARRSETSGRCVCGTEVPAGAYHSCEKPHPYQPAVITSSTDADKIPETLDLIRDMFGKIAEFEPASPAAIKSIP